MKNLSNKPRIKQQELPDKTCTNCRFQFTIGCLMFEYPVVQGMTEQELEEIYNKMFRESHAKQEKAHALVWKLISNHIRGWWD